MVELTTRRPFEQFVLLAVVELADEGETPAHSYDVAQRCRDRLDEMAQDPFGGVERQEVITALGALADDGLLSKERTSSPAGKGRPAYGLAAETGEILSSLEDAETVGPYAETLRVAE